MAVVIGEAGLGLRERKKLRTRATLIDAAAALCDRQGFDRTTVDQIAAIAEVSPRTFSRYFATKDAIAVALIDEVLDRTAVEMACQPRDLNPYEALRRSYVAMANAAKAAPAGELSGERLMCIVRIVMSSPALRQGALEYRANAVDVELANRMGVDLHDRRLRLIAAVWGSILMTALTDLCSDGRAWTGLTIDDIIERVDAVFAEFADLVAEVRLPA